MPVTAEQIEADRQRRRDAADAARLALVEAEAPLQTPVMGHLAALAVALCRLRRLPRLEGRDYQAAAVALGQRVARVCFDRRTELAEAIAAELRRLGFADWNELPGALERFAGVREAAKQAAVANDTEIALYLEQRQPGAGPAGAAGPSERGD